jgi:DNA-nicking Smr family endonuclease
METNDSINKPFSGLNAFLEKNKIALQKEAASPRKETHTEDDEHILSKAMKGVKTIPQKGRRVRAKKDVPLVGHSPDTAQDMLLKSILADSKTINVTNLPEYMEGYQEGINLLVMEKLRNGEFAVQQVIDLHGLSIESARETFEFFLSEAIKKGLKCVKVIHGRGLKSKRDPIIKDYVKTWILRAMHRKWITAFSNAVMQDGGPGATYILLRNRPGKKRLTIIG